MSKISFILNGEFVSTEQNPSMRLLDVLRNEYSLTGTKEGCGEGECGACAVLLDHRIVNSCSVILANVDGHEITTIEGFKKTKQYEVIKDSFGKTGGVQCGFCTPGMVIATESLLHENPHPTMDEIKVGLSGNLCRCTGYLMIFEAVKKASKDGEGLW